MDYTNLHKLLYKFVKFLTSSSTYNLDFTVISRTRCPEVMKNVQNENTRRGSLSHIHLVLSFAFFMNNTSLILHLLHHIRGAAVVKNDSNKEFVRYIV